MTTLYKLRAWFCFTQIYREGGNSDSTFNPPFYKGEETMNVSFWYHYQIIFLYNPDPMERHMQPYLTRKAQGGGEGRRLKFFNLSRLLASQ
jgi:hypothetical protein